MKHQTVELKFTALTLEERGDILRTELPYPVLSVRPSRRTNGWYANAFAAMLPKVVSANETSLS